MKKTEPVTISLLKTILRHYPVVPSHLIHSAGREACLSGGQRLRELAHGYGKFYTYKDHNYYITFLKDTMKVILFDEKAKRGIK